MRIRPLLSSLALALALSAPVTLGACEAMTNPLAPNPDNAMPSEGDFVRSKPMSVPEFDFLWERAKFMLQTDRFGVDGSRTSRDDKEIVSQWKTILAPARYQGKRRRVVMRFEEAGEGKWIASAAMVVQKNDDIQNPMEIARAVWKSDAPDLRRSEVYIYRLETGFAEPQAEDGTQAKPTNTR